MTTPWVPAFACLESIGPSTLWAVSRERLLKKEARQSATSLPWVVLLCEVQLTKFKFYRCSLNPRKCIFCGFRNIKTWWNLIFFLGEMPKNDFSWVWLKITTFCRETDTGPNGHPKTWRCGLHRPGSVAYVSKLGGMFGAQHGSAWFSCSALLSFAKRSRSNELNNIVARNFDGVYEGVAIGPGLIDSDRFW